MKINFSKDAWNMDELTYAYSYRFEERRTFTQMDDCVTNRKDDTIPGGFENVPLLTKAQYGAKTRIETRCAFDDMGAPYLMIADKLHIDEDGYARFGNYMEVVIWKDGINVWRMWMKDGKVSWKLLMGAKFDLSEGDIHTLSAEIGTESLTVAVDGKEIKVYIPDMYTAGHVGIGACEGYNRFYDMTVDGEQVKIL